MYRNHHANICVTILKNFKGFAILRDMKKDSSINISYGR
jgi:hypothetical protein